MRAEPASTTKRTPGTVSDVSATLVASTIRRPRCGWKMRCCSAADSRAYSGSTSVFGSSRRRRCSAASWISRSPLRNTSTSPGPTARSSSTASAMACTWSRSSTLPPSPLTRAERPVAHVHRIGAAADLDHRGAAEVLGEALGVDRRRGDHHVQVGSLREQAVEVAEEEVDVQAALVGLVDDDRVVAPQHPVALHLGQQDAVGHHLDPRVGADAVGEAHRVADGAAELDAHLLGDPLGDRARRQPARLGVADHPVRAPPGLEAQLGQLGALARTGLAGHDDHLVVAQRGHDLGAPLGDRQLRRVVQLQRRDRHRRDGTGERPMVARQFRPFVSRPWRARTPSPLRR